MRAHYRAIDFRFTVETDIPGAFATVDRLFAPFRDDGSDGPQADLSAGDRAGREPGQFELLVDGASIQRPPSPGSMLDWIIADMTTEAVTQTADLVCVHASAAALDGRAIVLPAPPEPREVDDGRRARARRVGSADRRGRAVRPPTTTCCTRSRDRWRCRTPPWRPSPAWPTPCPLLTRRSGAWTIT